MADIHLRKVPTRNAEYVEAFSNLYTSLRNSKPDRIVIVGDLVHDYLELQGEQLIMGIDFLNELASIAPVRITRGNHDLKKKNLKRMDSVEALVKATKNNNIIYYNETGFFEDDNVIWAVWHWGEKNNNPWRLKTAKDIPGQKKSGKTIIDLYHDPINGCKAVNGFDMNSKHFVSVNDFEGDYGFFGDIHKFQFIGGTNRAYSSSLIAQDITEGDDNFHGYLLWNITNGLTTKKPITTKWSYHNIPISPYTDFDDLDFEIFKPTELMTVRFVWNTLPQTRSKDNERKLSDYVKKKYKVAKIAHKNEFIVDNKIEVNENITLNNITNVAVQHEIFTEYLTKIGVDQAMIKDIIDLDDEITGLIDIDETNGGEWDIIKFGGENFMSYAKFDIDWRDMDGLFQILGKNTFGKTTIFKLLSYVLFGKTLETETRMKYGDMRFVNNRNGAKYCSSYIIFESNGEYFGAKRRTDITTMKDGTINGAPTTLGYYLLNDPDDVMDDKVNSLEILDEERRAATQKKIDTIIGSYDNFQRVVMTTSDTLNRILSNDMAVFIDSLLYDSGLDIFDKKLKGLKTYTDKLSQKIRYSCNVEETQNKNTLLDAEILVLNGNVEDIELVKLPELKGRIESGRTYIETMTKKLFKIDSDIYNLNIQDTQTKINKLNEDIQELNDKTDLLKKSMTPLCETYDEARLNELIVMRDNHKTKVYELNLSIKKIEQSIREEDHAKEIIRGNIFNHNKLGANKKEEIIKLAKSKTCPTCGQKMTTEHLIHVTKSIELLKQEMFDLVDQIAVMNEIDIPAHDSNIVDLNKDIDNIKIEITKLTDGMEVVLEEIGTLTNLKNDVQKRKEIQAEIDTMPLKIQNKKLNAEILQKKIDDHSNSLLQIEENNKVENIILKSKQKITELEHEENVEKGNLYQVKTQIENRIVTIKNNKILIEKFKVQEYEDSVMSTYKKCIHRDGIPRQMLSNYILPKINLTLEKILSVAQFKVWLDEDDLRPKLAYNNRPRSIIDCISASGKERTFSSIPLKFALNQINVKAKPTIFLLDEVMGKLDDESVEEFVELIHLIKNSMKKVLVVEHVAEINPDYLINVELDEDGISSLTIE